MPRTLPQIITHIRAVIRDPSISTTLIQTEDLTALCDAAQHYLDGDLRPVEPFHIDDEYNGTHASPDEN